MTTKATMATKATMTTATTRHAFHTHPITGFHSVLAADRAILSRVRSGSISPVIGVEIKMVDSRPTSTPVSLPTFIAVLWPSRKAYAGYFVGAYPSAGWFSDCGSDIKGPINALLKNPIFVPEYARVVSIQLRPVPSLPNARTLVSKLMIRVRGLYAERTDEFIDTLVHANNANSVGVPFDAFGFKQRRRYRTELGDAYRRFLNDGDEAEALRDAMNDAHAWSVPIQTILDNTYPRFRRCSCGHVEFRQEVVRCGNGNTYCQSCGDDLVYVEGADAHYHPDDVYYWESDGEYHLEEEESEGGSAESLMSYDADVTAHTTPYRGPVPTPYNDLVMGIELEMVAPSDPDNYVEGIRDNLGSNYVICKSDGSLPCNGLELVTAPRPLQRHIDAFSNWTPPSGFTAWKSGKCGMHVHIDSRSFTPLSLGKFVMLINRAENVEFIKSIAGRHPHVDSWAAEYSAAEDQDLLDTPAKASKGGHGDRYRMVNLTSLSRNEQHRLHVDMDGCCNHAFSTVELRIFRATLKRERLLAQIEFAHAAVRFCRDASWASLDGVAFKKWLAKQGKTYTNLAKWLGVVPKHGEVKQKSVYSNEK